MADLLVMPNKYTKGFDGSGPVETTFTPIPLRLALRSQWPTDAHAAAYSALLVDGERQQPIPRVNRGALKPGVDLEFNALLVDVDPPGHKLPYDTWRQDQLAKIPKDLARTVGWYFTTNGLRLVWELDPPALTHAYRRLVSHVHKRLAEAGVAVDTAAKEPQRLFRLPRVVRDGAPVNLPMDLSKLGPLPRPDLVFERGFAGAFPAVVREGQRDDFLISRAGQLRRGGAGEAAIREALGEINAKRCEPPVASEDLDRIAASAARYEPGVNLSLPVIVVESGRLGDLVSEATVALAAAEDVYQRNGELVEVAVPIATTEEQPRIVPFKAASLRAKLSLLAQWVRPGKDGPKPTNVPVDVAEALLQRTAWPGVRPLRSVATGPVLREDGEVISAPGYDRASGVLVVSLDEKPWQLTAPSPAEALATLQGLFDDFPFPGPEHVAVCVASIITASVRDAIDGPVPLHLVDASVRGAGKGLIADVVATIATGRPAPKMVQTAPEETEKRVTSALLGGARVVVIDNVTRPIGGAALDAAITSADWYGRRLGSSEMLTIRNDVFWIATGNNMTVRGDMARRVIRSYIDPHTGRPELRGGFKHPRLVKYVREHRLELLAAAIAIPQAYLAAGAPDQGLSPFGSFEAWSDLVRASLVWAGSVDPLATQEELALTADPTTAAARVLLEGLARAFPEGKPFSTREAVTAVKIAQGEIMEAAVELAGEGDQLGTRRLGWKLRSFLNRWFDDLALQREGRGKYGAKWKVVKKS